jgi:hypothetical protein
MFLIPHVLICFFKLLKGINLFIHNRFDSVHLDRTIHVFELEPASNVHPPNCNDAVQDFHERWLFWRVSTTEADDTNYTIDLGSGKRLGHGLHTTNFDNEVHPLVPVSQPLRRLTPVQILTIVDYVVNTQGFKCLYFGGAARRCDDGCASSKGELSSHLSASNQNVGDV